jgi:putative peptidoglycan lipid II flippase
MSKIRRSVLSTLAVLALKLVGSALGLIAAIGIAFFFGAGPATDAYYLARRAVSTVEAAFERYFAVIFLPGLVRSFQSSGVSGFRAIIGRLERRVYLYSIAGVIVAALCAPWIVQVLAPGFEGAAEERAIFYFRVLLISLPISMATGVTGTALNALRIFSLPVFARMSQRFFVVVALLLVPLGAGLDFLVWGVVVGTVVMLWIFFGAARRAWPRLESAERPADPDAAPRPAGEPWRIAAIIVMSAYFMISSMLDAAIASFAGPGALTIFAMAQRVTNAGAGQVGNAMLPVYYTSLAEAATGGDRARMARELSSALRAGLFFVGPVAAVMIALGHDIARILFGHGALDLGAVGTAGEVIELTGLAMILTVTAATISNAILCLTDFPHFRVLGLCALVALVLRAGVSWVLIEPLGVTGVAVGGAAAGLGYLVVSAIGIRSATGTLIDRTDRGRVIAISLAIVAVTALLWLATELSGAAQLGRLAHAALATGFTLAAAFGYIAAMRAAGVPEAEEIAAAAMRSLRRLTGPSR